MVLKASLLAGLALGGLLARVQMSWKHRAYGSMWHLVPFSEIPLKA